MKPIYERVLRTEYKPKCYILLSFKKLESAAKYGDTMAEPTMSFLYDSGEVAAEWCPPYGPIQIWHKAEEGKIYSKSTMFDDEPKEYVEAQSHYAYPFIIPKLAEWSQLAVREYELAEYAIDGNYDYIFNVLKDWTKER